MPNIDRLLEELIDREGGYVNDPADRGGATKFGITEGVARANGYTGDMRDFPRVEAKEIYRRIYWVRPAFDKVEQAVPKVAEELFDTGVNMGPAAASGFLQKLLTALNRGGTDYPDLKADGIIGQQTLNALSAFVAIRGRANAETVLLKGLDALQGARYIDLAEKNQSQEKFLYGWLANRLDNVK